MENPFTRHCRSVGETYAQHFMFAASFGAQMVRGGLACTIHAVLPFCFIRTGSTTVLRLHERITTGARKHTVQSHTGGRFGADARSLWHNEIGAGI